MSNAERLRKRLEEAGLTRQQVVEVISAVQEYVEARDNTIEGDKGGE